MQTMRKRGYGKMSLELVHRDISDINPLIAWFVAVVKPKLEVYPGSAESFFYMLV